MGILETCIVALGITADSVALGETLKRTITGEGNYTVEELFARCFRHAFAQRKPQLAHFSRPFDPESAKIDEKCLLSAVRQVNIDASSPAAITGLDGVAKRFAPSFRSVVIIPGHQLTSAEIDDQLGELVSVALTQFLTEIPLHNTAFRQVAAAYLHEGASAHQAQGSRLDVLCGAVEQLRRTIEERFRDHPCADATTIQNEGSRPELRNPFRIVTSENFDHDYARLARLFKAPSDYETIRAHDNLVIAGGRGCGKSMILKSLSVIPALEIERLRRAHPATEADRGRFTFADSGLDYFGVYIKLFRGFFSQYTPDSKLTELGAHVYFQHYFNMIVLRALLESLQQVQLQELLHIDAKAERDIVADLKGITQFTLTGSGIGAVLDAILEEEHHVTQYFTNLRLGNPNAQYQGSYTIIDKFLDDCCRAICEHVSELHECRIYLLLDEFENLADFQQKVVNTLAKLRPTSLAVKIATRAGGLRSMETLQGDAMQFPRDYQVVSLDYDVGKKEYKELLIEIARRRLLAEQVATTDIERLFPAAPPCAPLEAAVVDTEVKQMLASRGEDVAAYSEDQWKEKSHQWRNAMVFRIGRQRKKPCLYAGVDDLVKLSSGIISNFLELCKMAFYMAVWDGVDVRSGVPIPCRTQNEAVYKTSEAAFDWIAKNIADTGPTISQFIADVGAVIREKLLTHSSEPEAGRITIADPSALDRAANEGLVRILDDAVRWSVLQTPGAIRAYLPKHREDVRATEYFVNRILTPALRISPNVRWTTQFSASDLAHLCDGDTRKKKRAELIRKHGGATRKANRSGKKKENLPGLFPH